MIFNALRPNKNIIGSYLFMEKRFFFDFMKAKVLFRPLEISENRFSMQENYEIVEDPKYYKTNWLDASIIKRNGKAFKSDAKLLKYKDSKVFPNLPLQSLDYADKVQINDFKEDAKIVTISLKKYGFDLTRKWVDYFLSLYYTNEEQVPSNVLAKQLNEHQTFPRKPIASIRTIQISLNEYRSLSFLKTSFIENLKRDVPLPLQKSTYLTFGKSLVRKY